MDCHYNPVKTTIWMVTEDFCTVLCIVLYTVLFAENCMAELSLSRSAFRLFNLSIHTMIPLRRTPIVSLLTMSLLPLVIYSYHVMSQNTEVSFGEKNRVQSLFTAHSKSVQESRGRFFFHQQNLVSAAIYCIWRRKKTEIQWFKKKPLWCSETCFYIL